MLPHPELVEAVGAGYVQLLADYYWIETLQAVVAAKSPQEYRDIYDYAMMVVKLDPDFRPVYMFAGASIPVQDENKRWYNTEESTKLMQLGVTRFPNLLTLRILLAYNLSTYKHDYVAAAQNLIAASKLPGAPSYVRALATRLYSQAGDFDAGLALAQSVVDSATDPETRRVFEQRIRELQLERVLTGLDHLLDRYQQSFGKPASSLKELIKIGWLDGLPTDPLGGTLEIGKDGRSHSTAQPHRLHLFTEPQP